MTRQLSSYAKHDGECATWIMQTDGLGHQSFPLSCTCGLDALLSSPGRTESPILEFQEWLKKTGRSLTQDEYFLAQSAFYAAHPGDGPHSTTASPGRTTEEEKMAWQPIETAPKGTKVLLYTNDFGYRLLGCGEFKEFEDGSSGWIGSSFHQYGGKGWSTICRPSHWMPLPSAPEETTAPTNPPNMRDRE